MERNPHEFDEPQEFDEAKPRPDRSTGGRKGPERRPSHRHHESGSHQDGASGDEAQSTRPSGPEWFDPAWLHAMGAESDMNGHDATDAGATAPGSRGPRPVRIMIVVGDAREWALPGAEMDEALRTMGMLAWPRRRSIRTGTLLEQLDESDRTRREWLRANPFAVFWAATLRTRPGRRRR